MNTSQQHPEERRPIRTREWNVSQRVAQALARAGVSPNAISVSGMIFGILAGAALFATGRFSGWERIGWIFGAVFIQLRLLANMFDGMVAIETGRSSAAGELYNEIPDRVSDAATLIGLGYALNSEPLAGYAAAAMAIFTAYIRAMGKLVAGKQEFCGPMAKPQRMFVVTLVAIYFGLAPEAWLPGWSVPTAALWLIIIGGLLTVARRLAKVANTLRMAQPRS